MGIVKIYYRIERVYSGTENDNKEKIYYRIESMVQLRNGSRISEAGRSTIELKGNKDGAQIQAI